jgi:hypothetical protein
MKQVRFTAAAWAVLSATLLLGAGMPAAVLAAGSPSPSPSAPASSPSAQASSGPQSAFPSNIGPSQSDPVATVNTLFDVMIGRRFDQIASFACAASATDLDAHLNFKTALTPNVPAGFDLQGLIDAMSLTVPDRSITLVSNDGTDAKVTVVGTLVVGVDQVALRPWVKDLLVAAGEDSSDESIDAAVATISNSMTATKDMGRDVTLTLEDGHWLICDPTIGASPTP